MSAATATPAKKEEKTGLLATVANNARQYGIVGALLVIVVAFEILTGGVLLKPNSFVSLIQQNAYVIILAIGMVMVIIATHIDLSVGSVVAFIGGVGALIAKFAGASTLGFAFYLGLATTLVGGIIQLIAGINGVKHCNKPENAKKCITWGIIVIALAVISNVLEVIGGGNFNVLSFVIGLIVPVLYIYGAFLNHKENAR